MLTFARPEDPIFATILNGALSLMEANSKYELSASQYPFATRERRINDWWPVLYPHITACLPRDSAVELIMKLRGAVTQPIMYRLREYHRLLIFEALKIYCGLHNTLTEHYPNPLAP